MITLKYETINTPAFSTAIKRLMNCNSLPVKAAYTVAKIASKLEQEVKTASKLYTDLLKKHCELTAEGNLAPQMQTMKDAEGKEISHPIPGSFVPKEGHMDSLEAEIKEFMAIPFTLDYMPLSLDDLAGAKLSPQDLIDLETIINQPAMAEKPELVK